MGEGQGGGGRSRQAGHAGRLRLPRRVQAAQPARLQPQVLSTVPLGDGERPGGAGWGETESVLCWRLWASHFRTQRRKELTAPLSSRHFPVRFFSSTSSSPFPPNPIRFVQVVVDLSRASLVADMRPSRLKVVSEELQVSFGLGEGVPRATMLTPLIPPPQKKKSQRSSYASSLTPTPCLSSRSAARGTAWPRSSPSCPGRRTATWST